MGTIKQQRTAEQIRVIMSGLFQRGLHDPRLQALTVTDVTIDRELQYADIYVHALGEDERAEEVMQALKKAASFLRREVGQRMRLRTVPQLHFHWDPSLARAAHINELLDNLEIPPETAVSEEEE